MGILQMVFEFLLESIGSIIVQDLLACLAADFRQMNHSLNTISSQPPPL